MRNSEEILVFRSFATHKMNKFENPLKFGISAVQNSSFETQNSDETCFWNFRFQIVKFVLDAEAEEKSFFFIFLVRNEGRHDPA